MDAQLLKFNSMKNRRKEFTTEVVSVQQSVAQETPVPTYVCRTDITLSWKKEFVDGLSISYDHVTLPLSKNVKQSLWIIP